jgi:hypothetical protein
VAASTTPIASYPSLHISPAASRARGGGDATGARRKESGEESLPYEVRQGPRWSDVRSPALPGALPPLDYCRFVGPLSICRPSSSTTPALLLRGTDGHARRSGSGNDGDLLELRREVPSLAVDSGPPSSSSYV